MFFVGVTSTGIYCRPICPVETPKAANCRFFDTPQEAEHAVSGRACAAVRNWRREARRWTMRSASRS